MRLTTVPDWLRAEKRRLDVALAVATVGVGSLLFWAGPDDFDTGWPDIAAGVGAFALILFRRRQPFVLLAVALTWAIVHVLALDRPTVMIAINWKSGPPRRSVMLSPSVGRVMAEMILGREPSLPTAPFSLDRFENVSNEDGLVI